MFCVFFFGKALDPQRSIAVFECDSKDVYMISQMFLELFGKDKLVGEL